MSKQRKKYSKKEKLQIVSMSYDEGHSVKSLSQRFGVSENTIYNWRGQVNKHREAAFPGNGNPIMSESERQIAELKKALRDKELEVEILKKAVHIFSDAGRKSTRSQQTTNKSFPSRRCAKC